MDLENFEILGQKWLRISLNARNENEKWIWKKLYSNWSSLDSLSINTSLSLFSNIHILRWASNQVLVLEIWRPEKKYLLSRFEAVVLEIFRFEFAFAFFSLPYLISGYHYQGNLKKQRSFQKTIRQKAF